MTEANGQSDRRQHLRTALQKGELEFRRLLDKLPAGAYTCDPDGLITYFNQQAVELWGRAPKLNDPVDRYCGSLRLFAPDGSPIAHERCWMAQALRQEQEFNGHEIVIERPDGERRFALAHANPIRDESGELWGAVNVLIDISARKRAEDALKSADRAKDEFLATLAHELRNPLAPIRYAVHALHLKLPLLPEMQWALEVIERQMVQMTRLIDDLLDIARITRNRLELRKGRIELAGVLRAAAESSSPLIEARGLELTVSVPPEPLHLDGDAARLAQVISNLLNNAAKYTDPGGRVWLEAERRGGDAVVMVRDTGIGIPPEILPCIFELFTREDRSFERCRGGLGIGLTLVKRLVEMHGGSITAHSDGPGKGSEFIVRLPILLEPRPGARQKEAGKERAAFQSRLRVLVVDDNCDSAGTLGVLLRMMGGEIRTAHDGYRALEIAAEFLPEVVLLDIGLPGMNGYAVAQQIRREPWGQSVVLIALTGWGQETDRHRSEEAGFDYHLVKPTDPEALAELLVSVERVRGARPSAR